VTVSLRTPLLLSVLLAFGCNQIKALVGGNEKEKKEKPTAEAAAAKAEGEHGDDKAGADEAKAAKDKEAAPQAEEDEHAKERGKKDLGKKTAKKGAKEKDEEHGKDAPSTEPPSQRFGLPFAYETSPTEPLARARGFLAEVLGANLTQVAKGRPHFAPFIDVEAPRATVVACADSRVQASAWDQTPENDDFTIRNIGNQVSSTLGSIEYGVEQLHTPLLLIVGHTGCTAVKAALTKPAGLSEPILGELAQLKLPAARKGASAETALNEAVFANINTQVAAATQHFSSLVHSGELTVVGAVYDFRNELGKGFGKLQIVNVNTNTDPTRVESFLKAVQASPGVAGAKPGESTVEERVKKILDRAQRAFPPGKRPDVTVSSVELSPHDTGAGKHAH
jgi:carbonic anhydrase